MAHRSTWFKHRPPGGRQTDGAIAAQPDVNDTLPPTVTFAPDDPRPARDGRAAVGVALATLAAVLLTWPFADAPFNDDWSYALTARTLADTGRLAYNGWASASLVAQAYWGAAWIKAFGFSFAVLRLSTIPLSTAAVGLCYLLVRRAGLRPPLAAFASLLLGWSPLYLPVAATFMTDAPGLFFTLAALYALVRAVDAGSSRSAIGWLIAGMAVGGVGGTGRQIVWVVPLTVGPYAAYARRGDVAFAVAAAVSWAVVLGGAAWTVRWFNRQMLTIPEPSPLSDVVLAVGKPVHYVGNVVGLGLTVVWVTLPALWPLGRAVAARRRRGVAAVVLLAAVAAVIALRHHQAVRTAAARHEAPHADPAHLWPYAMAPWMDNTLDPHGVMGSSEIANDRPVALPTPVRVGLGVVVFAAAAAALAVAGDVLFSDPAGVARRAVGLFARPDPRRFARQAGAIFALAYVGLMLPRSARDMTFDRYVLPLLPVVAVPALLYAQRRADRVPRGAWVVLGVYAAYAVATTQEVTALARARTAAGGVLARAGVPRSAVHGGFEFNSWTQLLAKGRINDPRLHPRWRYHRQVGPTPVIKPLYVLEPAPGQGTQATPFGCVPYWSLMPPFRRQVSIDRYTDAWWTDPAQAATRPFRPAPYGLPDAALPADHDAADTPVPPGVTDDR